MESKNKTVLMAVIDGILEEVVWVSKGGEAVSLKEAIARNMRGGKSAGVESLAREDLIGALTSFQIRRQSFSENTKAMDDAQIAEVLKAFIFDEAKSQIAAVERELGISGQASARKSA
jgi:hypothetical protein